MPDSGDHLGRDPWRGPHRPFSALAAGAGVATGTATRPGDHVPLPALPVAAGWARRRGGEILRGWELSADTVETVSLIVSELVTNALQHGVGAAAGPETARCAECGSQVCMTLKDDPDGILVEVFDSSTVPPHPAADPYAPVLYGALGDGLDDLALGSERGRGLTIVANLSEEQGYYLPPGGGKVVWCAVKPEV